jgi:D,D-heptose 1,7-bisphosphate phosphatase
MQQPIKTETGSTLRLTAAKQPAIFLDRDGVLNVDKGYAFSISDLLIPQDVPDTLAALKKMGFLLVVISNQSGIARGYYTFSDVYVFHDALQMELYRLAAVKVDTFYICPHHPDGIIEELKQTCPCRKPGTKMVFDAVKDFNIDLKKSFLVGDKPTDIECAIRAGIPGIQIVAEAKYDRHPNATAYINTFAEILSVIKAL